MLSCNLLACYNVLMDDFMFLDTETTGNQLLEDRLFQVCYKIGTEIKDAYFKPPLPISIKSQSITHVTNRMVDDKEPFAGSAMSKDLSLLLKEKILVAHNAVFDITMLAHEDIEVPRFICTLKLARAMDPESKIPEYNMQYLRYYLDLDVEASAHEAKDDVIVLEALFKRLYAKVMEQQGTHEKAVEEMLRISLDPILYTMMNFGKHRGKKIEEIVMTDRPYLEWLLEQKLQSPGNEEDWIYSLKYHMKIAQ